MTVSRTPELRTAAPRTPDRGSLTVVLAACALLTGLHPGPADAHRRHRASGRARGIAAMAREAPAALDVNEASAHDLVLLPTVGPATARAIVTFRRTLRPLAATEDLSLLPGISENRLSQLRPYTKVVPP